MNESSLSKIDQQRVELATFCHDCDDMPRVDRAGETDGNGDEAIQIMHNGLRTYCGTHYGDYNVEVIRRLRGIHEPQEERVFHEVLKRLPNDAKMIELGSFWAYYSMWFLREISNGKAVMVEPVPSALKAGQRNFELNGFLGDFIHAAISDQPSEAMDVELWKGFTTHAPTITVDSVMQSHSIKRLDILHADIQGSEIKMLSGAQQALSKKEIDWIFISTHSENIHQTCINRLRSYGYHIVAEHTLGESYSIDGLIVASSQKTQLPISISKNRSLHSMKAKVRSILRTRILEPWGLRDRTI